MFEEKHPIYPQIHHPVIEFDVTYRTAMSLKIKNLKKKLKTLVFYGMSNDAIYITFRFV